SAGNAGSAAAAYAAAAGMKAHVAVPRDVPPVNLVEMRVNGADVILVDGLIDEAGRVMHERAARAGWFELNTLKEPYRQEGKKTLGIELAEQGGWGDDCLPDVIIFPTGGGTGIVGMWKAFAELGELGWIGRKRPKMVVVQATGCAPLVRAFEQGADHAEPWKDAATIAAGIRVPSAIGDYLVLQAIRESGGTAVAVTDDEIRAAQGRRPLRHQHRDEVLRARARPRRHERHDEDGAVREVDDELSQGKETARVSTSAKAGQGGYDPQPVYTEEDDARDQELCEPGEKQEEGEDEDPDDGPRGSEADDLNGGKTGIRVGDGYLDAWDKEAEGD
ncbi:MAG: threonine synthase, partial [Chloroflexi bacterium]